MECFRSLSIGAGTLPRCRWMRVSKRNFFLTRHSPCSASRYCCLRLTVASAVALACLFTLQVILAFYYRNDEGPHDRHIDLARLDVFRSRGRHLSIKGRPLVAILHTGFFASATAIQAAVPREDKASAIDQLPR